MHQLRVQGWLNIKGNIITFSIVLKWLVKAANGVGCKGNLISKLNNGLEPNVVSYTTIIVGVMIQVLIGARIWVFRLTKSPHTSKHLHQHLWYLETR